MDTVTVETGGGAATGAEVGEAGVEPSGTEATVVSPVRRVARDPVVLMAAALVLLPTIAAAVSALRNPWVPSDDWARLELQVRAVGTADTPLLGAWSRFGWDHPGPWPLYLLAAFYRLVPGEHGLLFAAAVLNLVAVGGCVAVAVRRARTPALVVLVGLAVLQRGMGVAVLADPWNPLLPILPFALYCLVCLELAIDRRPWMLPVAAACASFTVQAHIGFAQPVVLVGLAAAGLAWWARPGRAGATADPAVGAAGAADASRASGAVGARRRWRAALPTAAVLLVAWAPVVLDQVAGDGNVGTIVRWAVGDEAGPDMGVMNEGRLPPERIAGAAAWLLDPFGPWVGNDDHPVAYGFQLLGDRPPSLLLWVPVALVGALLAARTVAAGERRPLACAVVVAAAGVAATVTDLGSARGAPVLWPFRWVAVVTMLVWIAAGWAVTAAAAAAVRRRPGWPRWAGPARRVAAGGLLLLVAVSVVATVWRGSLGRQPVERASDELVRLVPAILEHARDEDVVVANSKVMLGAVDLGLPVVLARAGIPWIERDDPRAAGHPQLGIIHASDLAGAHGLAVASGQAEVLARSGPPGGGDPDAELVLLRIDADPPTELLTLPIEPDPPAP